MVGKEIDGNDICLAHRLKRADRVVTQLYNEHLAPLGIRGTQFSLLRVLHSAGSTTAAHIKDILVVDQTTVSRALKPLVRDGYVLVNEGETKREKALSLSSAGEDLYQRALGPWNTAQQRLQQQLGEQGGNALVELSKQIVAMKV